VPRRVAPALRDRVQLPEGALEVVVDHHVIQLWPVPHVGGGVLQPALDHVFRVGAAAAQPAFELRARGRQYEDRTAFGQRAAYLLRALPVDLEDQVLPLGERGLDRAARRPVAVVEDARVLEELAPSGHRLELVLRDEEVVAAVGLVRALPARRVGDGELQRRHARHQRADERRLARAGGRRNDEQVAAAQGRDRAFHA